MVAGKFAALLAAGQHGTLPRPSCTQTVAQ
jgi:hypothetical protein